MQLANTPVKRSMAESKMRFELEVDVTAGR